MVNIYMWALQRRPCWVCAVMVRDADEKCSPLWCSVMSFSFSFFDIAGRFLIGRTKPTGTVRQPFGQSGPKIDTASAKGTEKNAHS